MKLNVSDQIHISCSREEALSYLLDIRHIRDYEPKVSSIKVFPKSPTEGTYSAKGRFAGIPWEGKFSHRLNKNDFFSEMLFPSRGVSVSGGFVVKIGSRGCRIVHYENYDMPLWFVPLLILMKLYLTLALRRELLNIQNAVTRLRRVAAIPRKLP